MNDASRARPPALPISREVMEKGRLVHPSFTLNDLVDRVHGVAWDHEQLGGKYRRYLDAVWDSDAVEGAQAIDNVEAARVLREVAAGVPGCEDVAKKNLATLVRSLAVVTRRLGIARQQRRDQVGGETVRPSTNDQE